MLTQQGGLPQVIALARAGALEHAWKLFRATGYDKKHDDPTALSVKARLLKDQALGTGGLARRRLFAESAASYRRASEIGGGTYPLINAATLSLLAGDDAQAELLARQVLENIQVRPREPETPYYSAATRAEALLLLDRKGKAEGAFAQAISLAPHAWEEHASTLRQFGLIFDAKGQDASWLDAYRPPRSLHFGGHMSFDAKVVRRAHLDERIREVLEEEKIGFGYGALAAGADILIAEALLERGAVLHVVLPGGVDTFASVSVDPFGKAWRKRFDAVLERAETVRAVRPFGAAPDRATIGLADEIAMGAAVMNARRLESRVLQLLVLADEAQAEEARNRWGARGWHQRIVTAPREAPAADKAAPLPTTRRQCLAVIAIALRQDEAAEAQLKQFHHLLGQAIAPVIAPYFASGAVVLAYDDPADAARAAVALVKEAEAAIGGHYGVADALDDPFSGGRRLAGETVALAESSATSTPPGSICVTEDFAAALAASGETGVYSELVGELEARDGGGPIELYALKPRLN